VFGTSFEDAVTNFKSIDEVYYSFFTKYFYFMNCLPENNFGSYHVKSAQLKPHPFGFQLLYKPHACINRT
jgi:hypothetical protein